ncbi:signal peptidase II [Carboxydothermus pertinax]|uniref:Lipoprotein signal peptidase n=1 Tax=Carboxydothermus pertinax TaxID=870242 RepID=A0A1L8CXU6_9THEO|nr:signal peptidase II [Carboxydothermus pertinax]GAV23748.1 signal peptidase II [Carboxydothermus pertinax]
MLYFLIISFVFFLLDQLSKYYIIKNFAIGQSLNLLPFLSITHVKNPGAAFSLLPYQTEVFIVITIFVLSGILIYLVVTKNRNRLLLTSLALIFGGALGNFYDRITQGQVTDFLDFHFWPVFNLADSFITIGLLLFTYQYLFKKE